MSDEMHSCPCGEGPEPCPVDGRPACAPPAPRCTKCGDKGVFLLPWGKLMDCDCRRQSEDDPLAEMCAEANRAAAMWPPFNSAHEGFAVLLEEVEELKAHVWTNQKRRDLAAMRREAVQVGAMALRFIRDVCNEERGRK